MFGHRPMAPARLGGWGHMSQMRVHQVGGWGGRIQQMRIQPVLVIRRWPRGGPRVGVSEPWLAADGTMKRYVD